jgi:type I restriction enzyme R subunit
VGKVYLEPTPSARNYARTITNKVSESEAVMHQIRNSSAEQPLLGDFASAVENAVMESADAHQNPTNQILGNKNVAADFGRIMFDLLVAEMKTEQQGQRPPSSQRR